MHFSSYSKSEIYHTQEKEIDEDLLEMTSKVRTLEGGRGGPAKSVWLVWGEGGSSNRKRTYAIIFFSQICYKIEIKLFIKLTYF